MKPPPRHDHIQFYLLPYYNIDTFTLQLVIYPLKKRQKTDCSATKFTLRCSYRRTVDEINFDCGANLKAGNAFVSSLTKAFSTDH